MGSAQAIGHEIMMTWRWRYDLMLLCCAVAIGCGGQDEAERPASGPQLEVRLHELSGAWMADAGRGASVRRHLRDLAHVAEDAAGLAPDSAAQATWLRGAAIAYLLAALPHLDDPRDDPRRRTPGPTWTDYLRTAWRYVHMHPRGAERAEIAAILCPRAWVQGEWFHAGHLYGEAYGQPARQLIEISANPHVQAQAGLYVVELSLLGNWALACRTAGRVAALESRAEVTDGAAALHLYETMQRMHDVMARALYDCRNDIERALDLYRKRHHDYPQIERADAGRGLWEQLQPYLPDVIGRGRGDDRVAEWMDLTTNRMASVPGLRLIGLTERSERGMRPRLEIDWALVYWDDYLEADGTQALDWRPWAYRFEKRMEALGMATPAAVVEGRRFPQHPGPTQRPAPARDQAP